MSLQKKVILVFIFCLSIAALTIFITGPKKTENYTASSTATAIAAVTSTESSYCLAIRGNGELEPAHWGGMAKTIEQLGLPSAMAGGSSASISMFWLNAVAQHPMIQDPNLDLNEKKLRASLLVKSFLGFFGELKNTQFSQDFFKLYGQYNQAQAVAMTKEMQLQLLKKNYPTVKRVLKEGIKLGLFDETSLQPLFLSLSNQNDQRTQFYVNELSESVRLFGKFDSSTDANLFFRPGLVSFENASKSFARFAAFYSATSADQEILSAWTDFFKLCTTDSQGVSWAGLMQKNPACGQNFQQLFTAYFKSEPKSHLEESFIGKPIAVYPSTSVLISNAVQEVEQAFVDYDKQLDQKFGQNFKVSNPEEVRFGYWGDPQQLSRIEKSLDQADEKSRRFLALGLATWKQVLSLSPAEPGLAPLKRFTANNQKLISAGGWSDLHPVAVLKASGCSKVVYLTRQSGESLFAQGVANRLMSLNREVSKLTAQAAEDKAANTALNNAGDLSADPQGMWSKLFNMANPQSSINISLAQASAVLCTNWNAFDVKNNLEGLIEDAYQSSYWISPLVEKSADFNLTPVLQNKFPGCQPLSL